MELLSIMGMCNHSGEGFIFGELQVPEGIDVADVVDNILLQCAELEIVYPEPETLRHAIGIWSRSNKIMWNKLYQTMIVEYNPIWNVDADITESGTGNRVIGRSRQGQSTGTSNTNGTDNESINITDTKSVQGFNSSSWADSEKNVKAGTDNTTIQSTTTSQVQDSDSETTNDDSTNSNHIRRTGNIGVTTTQQMITQEREVAQFNLIEFITQSFKTRFCLMLY